MLCVCMNDSNRYFLLSKVMRKCRLVMAVFLTAMLIAGTAHTDFDQASDIDRNAADILLYDLNVHSDNQAALEASRETSCPTQSFCHDHQIFSAAIQAAKQPSIGNVRRLLPDRFSDPSRLSSLDDPPPIT